MTNKAYLQRAYQTNRNHWLSANSNGNKPVKILYMTHDLKNNYMNAEGEENKTMKRDILMSEIGKLIVYQPNKVIDYLNQAGFKTKKRMYSKKELVKMTSQALGTSKKFATMLVNEIVTGKGQNLTFAQDAVPTKPKTDFTKTLGTFSNILNGIGGIFGGRKKAEAGAAASKAEADKAAAEAAKAQAEAQKALIQATAGIGSQKSNVALYVGIAVGIVAIAGIIIYIMRKK